MSSARDIIVRPVSSADARAIIQREHYSGKYVNNSQVHFGVFLDGRLEGAMQFGPPMDKRKLLSLVSGTKWNGMAELNRMAFSENLPRNSESRALGIVLRSFRKHAPHVEWIVSFSDAAQCGDGTIYRASGFVLTGIKRNKSMLKAPNGEVFSDLRLHAGSTRVIRRAEAIAMQYNGGHQVPHILNGGGATNKGFLNAGFREISGFQLRYIYFLNPAARDRLTVPILPFSEIDRCGARMVRGIRVTSGASIESDAPGVQPGEGGAIPTAPLQFAEDQLRCRSADL